METNGGLPSLVGGAQDGRAQARETRTEGAAEAKPHTGNIGSQAAPLERDRGGEEKNFAQSVRILSEAMKSHIRSKAAAGDFGDPASENPDWVAAFRAARDAEGLEASDREAIDRFLARRMLGGGYGPGGKSEPGGDWLKLEA